MQGLTIGHCEAIFRDLGHPVEVDGDKRCVTVWSGSDWSRITYAAPRTVDSRGTPFVIGIPKPGIQTPPYILQVGRRMRH